MSLKIPYTIIAYDFFIFVLEVKGLDPKGFHHVTAVLEPVWKMFLYVCLHAKRKFFFVFKLVVCVFAVSIVVFTIEVVLWIHFVVSVAVSVVVVVIIVVVSVVSFVVSVIIVVVSVVSFVVSVIVGIFVFTSDWNKEQRG